MFSNDKQILVENILKLVEQLFCILLPTVPQKLTEPGYHYASIKNNAYSLL